MEENKENGKDIKSNKKNNSGVTAIGVVDMISFGSESGNIDKLTMVAERLSDSRISDRMVELAREGYSYPRSKAAAH